MTIYSLSKNLSKDSYENNTNKSWVVDLSNTPLSTKLSGTKIALRKIIVPVTLLSIDTPATISIQTDLVEFQSEGHWRNFLGVAQLPLLTDTPIAEYYYMIDIKQTFWIPISINCPTKAKFTISSPLLTSEITDPIYLIIED